MPNFTVAYKIRPKVCQYGNTYCLAQDICIMINIVPGHTTNNMAL